MKTANIVPNTPEWHAHRRQHFNASDASAALGCSPFKTRSQLLHELHTGMAAEVDSATQRRFDDGHRFEALARPLAEEIIGDDLAPVVGTEGELSASFDGLTLMGDTAWEHKTLSAELREVLDPHKSINDLPKHYRVQMEQQCLVAGCEKVLFMASKWDGETLIDERHCWYYPDPALRAEIIAAWKQLAADLATYVPPAAADPAPVGRAPETLPALHIEVTGMVTASNLAAFKEHALAVFGGINRNLATDADFANAEKTVKWCGEVEDRLKAAKQHALSQTASIDALFSAIDDIGAEARAVRLELDKLVKARKEAIRGEIVAEAIAALREHVSKLNARLDHPYMPPIAADFAGAIKNKRTVDSLRDGVSTTLANAKIEASAIADRIDANLKTMHRLAGGYTGMFPDAAALVLKAPEDFEATVKLRVAEREQAEAARLAAEAAKPAPTPAPAPIASPAVLWNGPRNPDGSCAPIGSATATATPNVVPLGTRAPAADPAATIRLGQLNERLAPIQLSADGLAALGFKPVATDKAAKLYREADLARICAALIHRLEAVRQPLAA